MSMMPVPVQRANYSLPYECKPVTFAEFSYATQRALPQEHSFYMSQSPERKPLSFSWSKRDPQTEAELLGRAEHSHMTEDPMKFISSHQLQLKFFDLGNEYRVKRQELDTAVSLAKTECKQFELEHLQHRQTELENMYMCKRQELHRNLRLVSERERLMLWEHGPVQGLNIQSYDPWESEPGKPKDSQATQPPLPPKHSPQSPEETLSFKRHKPDPQTETESSGRAERSHTD